MSLIVPATVASSLNVTTRDLRVGSLVTKEIVSHRFERRLMICYAKMDLDYGSDDPKMAQPPSWWCFDANGRKNLLTPYDRWRLEIL